MTTRDLFRDLCRHMEWADASMWAAVMGSEAARSDGALRDLLHHLHLVQRSFLSVWRGEPIDRHAGEGLEGAALVTWAREYYPQAQAHISSVSETALAEPLQLPWSRYVADHLGYEPAPTTLGETMMQVYAHTAHHRGQVMSALRRLGVTPPTIDYIAWLWQGRPVAPWPQG